MTSGKQPTEILASLDGILPQLEALYKDIDSHPELSMQETRTAGIAAGHLEASGFEVTTGVGKTGVVGILRNGDRPTVMCAPTWMRCPSRKRPVFLTPVRLRDGPPRQDHARGALLRARHARGLPDRGRVAVCQDRDSWHGTLMAVFQPGEETAQGAQAMIDDNLFKRFSKPDVVLGQHVMSLPSGHLDWRTGVVTSSADSLQIRMFGRGGHGSMPETCIDPVVMAASTIIRLQTIVSREVAPRETAVVTVGTVQARHKRRRHP